MKKRFYTFDDIINSESGQTFKNFTKGRTIPESISSMEDLFVTIELEDNVKLEYISLQYYNTLDYWDILMMLNNMIDINKLPKDMDTVLQKVDADLEEHLRYFSIAEYPSVGSLGLEYDYSDPLYLKIRNPLNANGDDVILENAQIYTVHNTDEDKISKFTKNQSHKILDGTYYDLTEPLELVEKRVPVTKIGLTINFISKTNVSLINETQDIISLIGGWYYSFTDSDNNKYKTKITVNTDILPGTEYKINTRVQPESAVDDYIIAKKAELQLELENENEKYRTFRIVKGEKITEFLKLLDDYVVALRIENDNIK